MIGIFVTSRRWRVRPPTGAQPDLTPPVISGLSIDQAQRLFTFSSSEIGACHWLIDSTSAFLDTSALVAAKPAGEASGSALVLAGFNIGNFDPTVITTGAWRLHVGVIDAAGHASNVLSGDLTITSGGLELNGDPLTWNGDQLIFNAA